MKPKHKRLIVVLISLACIFTGTFILLNNFKDNLIYFYPPKDIEVMRTTDAPKFEKLLKKQIRVGGMVKPQSYQKSGESSHEFVVTDYTNDLKIKYNGLLPPMFREGQGIVAQGNLQVKGEENSNNQLPITNYYFNAVQLITKHDEKYMPPEVKRSLGEGKKN